MATYCLRKLLYLNIFDLTIFTDVSVSTVLCGAFSKMIQLLIENIINGENILMGPQSSINLKVWKETGTTTVLNKDGIDITNNTIQTATYLTQTAIIRQEQPLAI